MKKNNFKVKKREENLEFCEREGCFYMTTISLFEKNKDKEETINLCTKCFAEFAMIEVMYFTNSMPLEEIYDLVASLVDEIQLFGKEETIKNDTKIERPAFPSSWDPNPEDIN